jgi:hypothetical protein
MRAQSKAADEIHARMRTYPSLVGGAEAAGFYTVKCFDPHGEFKWSAEIHNVVVDGGQDNLLDVTLNAGTQITVWYIGLTDGSPTVAETDTIGSHSGWSEVTAYDEANRQTCSFGSVSSQSVDNSASPATFTISTNSTTIGGAFLVSDNTKGGTSGTLYSVGAFTGGDKTADDGDTLEVTFTATMADDGA